MIKGLEKRKEKTKSYQDHTLTTTRGNVFDGMRQLSLTVYFRTEPMLYYNREKKALAVGVLGSLGELVNHVKFHLCYV
jgi:hypothetical protein